MYSHLVKWTHFIGQPQAAAVSMDGSDYIGKQTQVRFVPTAMVDGANMHNKWLVICTTLAFDLGGAGETR